MLLTAAALLMIGCKKATFLKSEESQIRVGLTGGQGIIHLHSDANSFDVTEIPEWIEYTMLDSTMVYYVKANNTGQMRNGNVIIASSEQSVKVDVFQAFKATHITPETTTLDFPKEGGTKRVNIDTDGADINVTTPENIKAEMKNNTLVVTVKPNDAGSIRGDIVLKIDSISSTIKFTVEGNFCGKCNGRGKIKCPRCHGDGGYMINRYGSYGWTGCTSCGGEDGGPCVIASAMRMMRGFGVVTCPDCKGKGK